MGAKKRTFFPLRWRMELLKNVLLYHRLPRTLKHRLHGLILEFLERIPIDASNVGKEPNSTRTWKATEKMKVCVAAEACILILQKDIHAYDHDLC